MSNKRTYYDAIFTTLFGRRKKKTAKFKGMKFVYLLYDQYDIFVHILVFFKWKINVVRLHSTQFLHLLHDVFDHIDITYLHIYFTDAF